MFVVTLTSTSKGELEDQLISIDEVEFLSRAFFTDGQFVKCPLSYESIVSQLYYVRLPKSEKVNGAYALKQLQQNLDGVIRESVELPEDEARSLIYDLRDFIREHELALTIDYAYLRNRDLIKGLN